MQCIYLPLDISQVNNIDNTTPPKKGVNTYNKIYGGTSMNKACLTSNQAYV